MFTTIITVLLFSNMVAIWWALRNDNGQLFMEALLLMMIELVILIFIPAGF